MSQVYTRQVPLRVLLTLGLTALPLSLAAEGIDTLAAHQLDEVIVSAYIPQRPTALTGLQPAAQSWLSRKELKRYRVQQLTDLTSRVPSLFIPDYGSRRSAAIYLRGSGARSVGQTIGLYIDGVPVLNKAGFNLELPAISGIEVLRGPQGTLYGRNAQSGIINYYTRSAFERPGGELRLSMGSHGLYRASLEQSLRLGERWGLSYGLIGTTRRGYFDNVTTGRAQDSLRSLTGFLKLEYRPTERLQMALSATGDYVDQGAFPYRQVSPEGKVAPLSSDAPETYGRRSLALRYLLSYQWERMQLQSATGYQYLWDQTEMDMDKTATDLYHVQQRLREHGLTQELILRSRGGHEAAYRWTLGLFGYYDPKQLEAPVHFSYPGISGQINGAIRGMKAALARTNPQAARRMPDLSYVDPQRRGVVNTNSFEQPEWGIALYHESALRLLPQLTLTAGLRLDYEHHQLDYRIGGYPMPLQITTPRGPLAITLPAGSLEGRQQSESWQLLPKFALQWTPLEGLQAFATVTRGAKAGGFNEQGFSELIAQVQLQDGMAMSPGSSSQPFDRSTIAARTTYSPETSWSYELGGRYERPETGTRLELSAYLQQVHDLQLTRFVASGAGRVVGNAGASQALGLELSASQRIFAPLTAQISYNYTDARFTETAGAGIKDKHVPFIPQHSFSAMLAYSEEVARGLRLFWEAEASGVGAIYWDEANQYREPMQTTLRARLGAEHGRLSLALWANNLLNRSYQIFSYRLMGSNYAQLSAPRTFGLELGLRF